MLFIRKIWFIAVRGEFKTCDASKIALFRKNTALQLKVIHNFDKKLHFQICCGLLNLPWIFLGLLFLYTFFLLVTFLNINGTSTLLTNLCLTNRDGCHGVWMFWLTLGRSLHFFLVILLSIVNANLWPLYVEDQKEFIFMGVVAIIRPMGRSSEIFVYKLLWRCHFKFLLLCIGKTCSKSLMGFNNRISTYSFISLLTLSKISQCFKVLILNIETVFN